MGNIFGRWQGSDAAAGAVLTGSHCDAIPLAGMYDGTLGVIGGIEALAALRRAVSLRCGSRGSGRAVIASVAAATRVLCCRACPAAWRLRVPRLAALLLLLGACAWLCVLLPLQGFRPKRSLEVIMFTSEEPTRFKLSCIGSRAMAGALGADVLDAKRDDNGTSFLEVMAGQCWGGVSTAGGA